MKKKAFWRLILLLYAGLIFALSSLPFRGGEPLLPVPYGDKVLHFAEFFLFGLLAVASSFGRRPIPTAFLIAALYAGTDEFHQLFVPLRDASFADWGADLAGAAFAVLVVVLLPRRSLSGVRPGFILTGRDSDKGE